MKKCIIFLIFFAAAGYCYAAENVLSKQATAFYSDNNNQRAVDMILQINEKDRSAQDWLLLGNISEDNGEPENALFMYKKALEVDSKYYKAYYNIANYYVSKGQFEEAVINYKKAIKYKYDNPYLYYNLACTYIKMEQYVKARANLNKAIMYKSDVPEFHYNLAYVYKKLEKPEMAEKYFCNYKQLTENH